MLAGLPMKDKGGIWTEEERDLSMDLGGGGGFWELSSAFHSSPAQANFTQHEPAVLRSDRFVAGDGSRAAHGNYYHNSNQVLGTGESRDVMSGFGVVDQHLTCLKLGKRHYFEDAGDRRLPHMAIWLGEKKGKEFVGRGSGGSSSQLALPVARCQVEGCNLPLVDAKEYHRKHKVCEMHSKAPKVVVLGLEQRFCQQCSRFHVVSEFDYSKRSCRRRLAGHNERRRKSSNEAYTLKNPSQGDTYQFIPSSPKGSALSLLSSKANPTTSSSWDSSDLSLLSSVALCELIAENRAAALTRQLASVNRSWPSHIPDHASCSSQPFVSQANTQHAQHFLTPESSHDGRSHFHQPAHAHVTLDLMQSPSSSYQPGMRNAKARSEECCGIWKSLEGTHIV